MGFASGPALLVDYETLNKAFPWLRELVHAHTSAQPEDVPTQVESIHSQWVERQEETGDHRNCLIGISQVVGMPRYVRQVYHKLQSSGGSKG